MHISWVIKIVKNRESEVLSTPVLHTRQTIHKLSGLSLYGRNLIPQLAYQAIIFKCAVYCDESLLCRLRIPIKSIADL